ncbi:MAG: RluA family pseudouridine synthase [Acidimicrobiia bacterium]
MADEVELEVTDDLDGARVDKALSVLLSLSRARATLLAESGVEVDDAPARPSDRVRTGQVLRCARPEETLGLEPEEIEFGVLYEDQELIVVDKPAGLVVHPGSGRQRGTLAAGLIDRYPELKGVGSADRWGLVHRLDKDTSGALLVARTQASFAALTEQLRERRLGRVYLALVEGRMGAPTGTVEAPIGRDPSRPTRRTVTHGGKHARTHFEVLEEFPDADASLLEVRLETGRTHQIRVHMAAIGHVVAGDLTYGAVRKDLGSPRTFLHASQLELDHPVTGEHLVVGSPLPPDLDRVLDRLRGV